MATKEKNRKPNLKTTGPVKPEPLFIDLARECAGIIRKVLADTRLPKPQFPAGPQERASVRRAQRRYDGDCRNIKSVYHRLESLAISLDPETKHAVPLSEELVEVLCDQADRAMELLGHFEVRLLMAREELGGRLVA